MDMKRGLLFAALALPLAAASNGALTDSERTYLIQQLESSKKNFLASISGVSDAQWSFKPAPQVWSVAECAEHIVLSEDFIFGLSQQLLKSPAVERPASSNADQDRKIVAMIQDRSQKAQAPEPIVPSGKFRSSADVVAEFTKRRDRTLAYVRTTNDDLRTHVSNGTPMGTADAYQVLLLLASHSARHTLQIAEVQSNAGYPKAAAAAKKKFIVEYVLARAVPLDQLTEQEMTVLGQHGMYLQSGVERGILAWGGRTTGKLVHGVGMFEVASEEELRTYLANDPAVKAGVIKTQVDPFEELFRKKM
jgi:hypothetical protein